MNSFIFFFAVAVGRLAHVVRFCFASLGVVVYAARLQYGLVPASQSQSDFIFLPCFVFVLFTVAVWFGVFPVRFFALPRSALRPVYGLVPGISNSSPIPLFFSPLPSLWHSHLNERRTTNRPHHRRIDFPTAAAAVSTTAIRAGDDRGSTTEFACSAEPRQGFSNRAKRSSFRRSYVQQL